MSHRQPNEFYPTDPDLALAITQRVVEILKGKPITGIVEPSAGTGSFIHAAKKVWSGRPTIAVDIDPRMEPFLRTAGADTVLIGDWIDMTAFGFIPGVLALGNPPFSLAQRHIVAGFTAPMPLTYQAMLLRMSFMGSHERVDFWNQYPARYGFTLVPRPNFQKGQRDPETGKLKGGDNSEYATYIWEYGYQGPTEWLAPLVWRSSRKKRN